MHKWGVSGPYGPLTPHLCIERGVFCVVPNTRMRALYGIGSASRMRLTCTELTCLVHSLTNFFSFSVVTLNSSLYYQIFEFDTSIIQILVWIIGSKCIQKRGIFEAKLECQHWATGIYFTITWDTHGTMGVVVTSTGTCRLPWPFKVQGFSTVFKKWLTERLSVSVLVLPVQVYWLPWLLKALVNIVFS